MPNKRLNTIIAVALMLISVALPVSGTNITPVPMILSIVLSLILAFIAVVLAVSNTPVNQDKPSRATLLIIGIFMALHVIVFLLFPIIG